jgi:hypothetical protein
MRMVKSGSVIGRLIPISVLVVGVLGVVTAMPADASAGPLLYTSYESGYQVLDATFQYAQSTFTIPNDSTGLGLVGIVLTDLNAGTEAACGLVETGSASGYIGCFDDAANTGFLPQIIVAAGDKVAVSIHYAQSGKMTFKATDLTSGETRSATVKGPTGEAYNEAFIGAIIENSAIPVPSNPATLSSFREVRLTPVCGSRAALSTGPWTVQPVIDTLSGEPSTHVVAEPSGIIKRNAFSVIEKS